MKIQLFMKKNINSLLKGTGYSRGENANFIMVITLMTITIGTMSVRLCSTASQYYLMESSQANT